MQYSSGFLKLLLLVNYTPVMLIVDNIYTIFSVMEFFFLL